MKGRISISLRLTMLFGGVFFFGWVLFGASMWDILRSTMVSERRQTLTRRIERLQTLLAKDQTTPASKRYQDFAAFSRATGNGLAEVLRLDGSPAYPSPTSAALSFSWPKIHNTNTEVFLSVQSGGQPYWVLSHPFSLEGEPLLLLTAAPEAGNLILLQSFLKGLLASAPLLLLLSSVGGYWISRRALQPVDRIAAKARSISIGNLSERLPVSESGDELQRLAETCNAMLGRLESAVKQLQQFTADASHELRGPLSFTRTVAEVALRNAHLDPESRRALEDIVDETTKAAVLLENMLTLARADAGPVNLILEPINLNAVIDEVYEMARPIAQQNGLHLVIVGNHARPVATVLGDFSSVRRLVWILLDNALKYTDPQGTIEVSLTVNPERATLTVRDNGIGISAEDLPRIFDRFYRADPSRGMVEGNGLGLSIAKWIAETHRAELLVASEEHIGSTFRLILPLGT